MTALRNWALCSAAGSGAYVVAIAIASSLKFPQPLSSGLLGDPAPPIRTYFNEQLLAIDEGATD
jgi:hypothetical protein